MIVETMTLEEIARQYMGDFPNFVAKRHYFQPKFESLVKRSTRFPVTAQYEYVSHINKNRYLFCYSALKRGDWKAPHANVVGIFDGPGGKQAIVSVNMKQGVIILTPHFFSRYRERILGGEEIHGEELIKRYFRKNQRMTIEPMNEQFAQAFKKHEAEGAVSMAGRVAEGNVFFRIYNDNIILCVTILSDEMLKDNQVAAFGKLKDRYEELKDVKLEGFKDDF